MRFRSFLLALAVVSASSRAFAQSQPSLDARTWKPSTDPAAGLVLEPVATQGSWNYSVGGWLSYAHHPVTLRKGGSDDVAFRPIQSLLGFDFAANLGLGSRASIGVDVPFYLYQDGSSGLPLTVSTTGKVPANGIGDIALHGKGVLVDNQGGGFGLAALGVLTLPTGTDASFMGEGAATVGARLLAEYTLIVASVQASAGYTLRTSHRVWPDAAAGGITFGDSIPWSFGLTIKPDLFKLDSANRQRWELALHGSLPAGPVLPFGAGDPGSAQLSPMLLAASDRVELGHYHDAYFVGGAEVGLTSAVGVPVFRAMLGLGYAPRSHDMDKDGVPDDVDQCPEIPEDRDGFEDSDGCPEIDNDDDGVLDKEDACRDVAGSPSDDPKKNGCPAADRDRDGVPDESDACPDAKGPETGDPKTNGCPRIGDRDGDGIADDVDRCPDQPEDKDGAQDADGCPDEDDDGDGIADAVDACPRAPGDASNDPKTNGCPSVDRDGDAIDDDADKCPNEAETYNGVADDDGCADTGGRALVVIDTKGAPVVKLAGAIAFAGTTETPMIAKGSEVTLRALATEMNRHREWSIAVGTRPAAATDVARQASLARAAAVAKRLGELTHREVSEAVAWDAVKRQAGAGAIGFLILTAPAKAQEKVLTPSNVPNTPNAAPAPKGP